MTAPLSLTRIGLRLEMSAGAINSLAARCQTDADLLDALDAAIEAHELLRDEYREALAHAAGQPASLIERRLAL